MAPVTEAEETLTASESVYRQLRHDIINFTLQPGEALSENSLAAQMNTSRAPIREAIARLVEEQCVEVYPQRGTQVSLISIPRVNQIVFMRTVLEEDVLRALCQQGITDEQMAALEESLRLQRKYCEAHETERLLDEDTNMHKLMYGFLGREETWDTYSFINCDMLRIRQLQIMTYSYETHMISVGSWENHLTEHRMMLDSLRRRDADALSVINRQHLGFIARDGDYLRRIYPQYFEASEPNEYLAF